MGGIASGFQDALDLPSTSNLMAALTNASFPGCKPFTSTAAGQARCRTITRVSKGRVPNPEHAQSEPGAAFVAVLAAATVSLSAQPALAAFRLPPLDSDPNRCERAYSGNTIGQANAVSDKVLDLRQCKYPGKNLSTKVLSGALISDADFTKATLRETVLTKAYAVNANFEGADLTNAVIDRVDFTRANLKGAKFVNAVITGSVFKDADLSDTVFEDALVGGEDVKRM